MARVTRAEAKAVCARNCFHKAGFVDMPNAASNAEPDASQEDKSTDDLWQRVVSFDTSGRDIGWDNFVSVDDDADIAEPCTDDGIIC